MSEGSLSFVNGSGSVREEGQLVVGLMLSLGCVEDSDEGR